MDRDVLLKVKAGDEDAFAYLYNHLSEYALRTASAIIGSHALAADAVQETFIRTYYNIKSFDTNRPFKPWFYKILVNECYRVLKNKAKTVYITDYMDRGLELADNDRHQFLEYEELYRAIQRLNDIYRIPVVLKYLGGFTEKEIAEVLSSNLNTVKSRLLRGREKLKGFLEEAEQRGLKHG